MRLFVDTSAFLAFLDADQPRHADVVDAWSRAVSEDADFSRQGFGLLPA